MDWPTVVVESVKYLAIMGGVIAVCWMLRALFGR